MEVKPVNTDTLLKRKARALTRGTAMIAFLAFAIVTTLTVASITSAVRYGKVTMKNGTPAAWNVDSVSTTLATETSAKQVEARDVDFVQYTTSIKNNSEAGYYLTHAAAFVTESADERSGFLPLSGNSVEYTYTPEDESSWVIIAIANPANNHYGSMLSDEVYLAAAGTEHDTVYFRFNARPGNTTENTINTQVEFLARNVSGDSEFTKSTTQIAYAETITPEPDTIAMEETDATQVLGEEDFVPTTNIIGGILPTAKDDLVGSTSLWILAVSGVLLISILFYLPARR